MRSQQKLFLPGKLLDAPYNAVLLRNILGASQIGLEFRSVCIGGDGDADFDIVCSATKFELTLRLDQILDAGVGVRFNYGLNPDEGTDCCRKPIGPVGNCVKNKALHIHHAPWLRW